MMIRYLASAVVAAMMSCGPLANAQESEPMASGPVKLSPQSQLEQIEQNAQGPRFVRADAREGLTTFLYAPRGSDPQAPHDRDEVYVVVSGEGSFVSSGERVSFAPGDVLFAAAHEEHRIEDFSEDLALWVFFYGAEHPASAG